MIKQIAMAAGLMVMVAATASAEGYSYWRAEACGNGGIPGSKCEQAFRRLCGKAPNGACVRQNQRTFSRASSFAH